MAKKRKSKAADVEVLDEDEDEALVTSEDADESVEEEVEVEDEELADTEDEADEGEEGEDVDADGTPRIERAILIPIEQVEKNDWNPFEQPDETFNLLVEEMESEGFDSPAIVVPIEDSKTTSEIVEVEDGELAGWLVEQGNRRYKIVDGEHRWKGARVAGYEYLPCTIKNWDERTQKIQTVRRNMIRGIVNPRKFSNLIEDIRKRYKLGPEAAARKMGVFNEKEFKKYYLQKRQTQAKANAKRRSEQKAVQAVENMTATLNEIFKKSGKTVSQGFVSFTWKGEVHMLVGMDQALKRTIAALTEFLELSNLDACSFLHEAIEAKMLKTAIASDLVSKSDPDDEEAPTKKKRKKKQAAAEEDASAEE